MSAVLLSQEIHKVASNPTSLPPRHTGMRQRIIWILLGVLILHTAVLVFFALSKSKLQPIPAVTTIAIRLVTVAPTPPKPMPPKPIVKPKVVPIVKELPKPKPLPILVAPKSAPSPVVAPPQEKAIEKPVPQAVPESTPAPAAVAAPAKSEPAPPKMVEGVAYLQPPDIVYPESARISGDEGTTIVRALINANGTVDSATVEKGSGSSILDRAALSAVKKTRFKPYRENGVAQAVYTLIPIAYSLDQ